MMFSWPKWFDTKTIYDISSNVIQAGGFFMAEFSGNNRTGFINVTLSETRYNRIDHFAKRDSDGNEMESGWQKFTGGTIKTGFNQRFDNGLSVYANTGFMSRAPMLSNTFYGTSLSVYDNLKNEEITSSELGLNYSSKQIKASLNVYNTFWMNRPVNGVRTNGSENYYYNIPGMLAVHKGIELDADYNIHKKVSAEGVISIGDWRWKSANTVFLTDENGNPIGSPVQFDAENVRVGDAAQFQTSFAVRVAPVKGLYFKPRVTYFDNNFSDFNPEALSGDNGGQQSWKMPSYYMIDVSLGYSRDIGKNYNLGARINLLNITKNVFITDALNNEFGTKFDAASAGVYYGMGFRWTAGLTLTIR